MTRFKRERKDGKGTQEMGAKERSEKLRRRKLSLEEEGQRGKENEVFALSRGKGQSLSQPGLVRPTLGEGAPGRTEAAARSPGSPGIPAPAALPEPLLSRRVPELQLYPLARLDFQQAREEVHADGGVTGGGAQPGKAALGEAMQQARLAHGGVPDHDEAELVDPDGLHHSRAPPPHPPSARKVLRRELSLQHLPGAHPLASSIFLRCSRAWSPPSLVGEAGPCRSGGVASR